MHLIIASIDKVLLALDLCPILASKPRQKSWYQSDWVGQAVGLTLPAPFPNEETPASPNGEDSQFCV